jgi:hypothetical protein
LNNVKDRAPQVQNLNSEWTYGSSISTWGEDDFVECGRAGHLAFPINMTPITTGGTTSPRKHSWLKIGIVGLMSLVLLILIRGVHFTNAKSVELAITQSLPPESDVASVRQFVADHHIVDVGCSSSLGACYGKIYRASVSLFTKSYIFIEFDFNEKGKLISHQVHELHQFAWE